MSTTIHIFPQKYSDEIIEDRWKCLHNMDMKARSQVKINFNADFKTRFDAEVERRRRKPAALATAVLEWWLKQPPFVQALATEGFEAIPETAREPVMKAIVEHFMREAEVNQQASASSPPMDEASIRAAFEAGGAKAVANQTKKEQGAGKQRKKNDAG